MLRGLTVGLLVCAACTVSCSPVDEDLLGPIATPCELGEPGTSVDVTPPGITGSGGVPGILEVLIDPFDRSVLYASTYQRGVWRTADCGDTWTHVNTGINAPMIENSIPLGFAVDRFVPDTLYIGARYGGQSLWMSDTAGVHWAKILPADVATPLWNGEADIARIATLPDAPHHLIATSVVGWTGHDGDSGVIEGRLDGETWHWTAHPPIAGMGSQQGLVVLDARTWLVVSSSISGGATWITRDAGGTFERLDDYVAVDDGLQVYRGANGTWYRPSSSGLLRSADGGATWIDVFAGLGLGGTRAVIGDGTTLVASAGIPDGDEVVRLFSAPELPGDRDWTRIGEPTTHSIVRFVRDELRDVLYALTGDGRVQRTTP